MSLSRVHGSKTRETRKRKKPFESNLQNRGPKIIDYCRKIIGEWNSGRHYRGSRRRDENVSSTNLKAIAKRDLNPDKLCRVQSKRD
jgi:hypothetical protein